jgi:hypothetical protein
LFKAAFLLQFFFFGCEDDEKTWTFSVANSNDFWGKISPKIFLKLKLKKKKKFAKFFIHGSIG